MTSSWPGSMPGVPSYALQVEGFEGPFELLLHLVERGELDITSVSLAAVADQFLAHIRLLVEARLDDLAAFLAVAAHLLVLKSRALLPRREQPAASQGPDPEELERRLQEYRLVSRAAEALRDRHDEGWQVFPRVAPPPELPRVAPERLLDVGPDVLARTLRRLLAARTIAAPAAPPSGTPLLSLRRRMESLLAELERTPVLSFQWTVESCTSRGEVVATFLAVLELYGSGQIRLRQDALFADIWLSRRGIPAPATGDARNAAPRDGDS